MIEETEDVAGGKKWSPGWARTVSHLSLLIYLGIAVTQVQIIQHDQSYRSNMLDGLGTLVGSVGLGILAVCSTSSVMFLAFGGKWKFAVSAVLLTIVITSLSWLFLL